MITGNMFRDMIISAANNIENNKNAINALNVFPVPDGDTGTNMSLTISAAAKAMRSVSDKSIGETSQMVASALLKGARGNSGVILSLLFRGISKGFAGLDTADAVAVSKAFEMGVSAAYGAVMKPTEGTILTVARVAAENTKSYVESTRTAKQTFAFYLNEAQKTLDKTPEMLPVLKQANVVDAGGKGLTTILEGMYAVLEGAPVEAGTVVEDEIPADFSEFNVFESEEDIVFAYCTEYIVNKEAKAEKTDAGELRKYLESIGDCVVVVDDDEIIKVHVHTNHPGRAFEEALRFGSLVNMKVENMREQFKEKKPAPVVINKKYGFVSVAAGEGLAALFKDMGVDVVVEGGQTMNPSTDDILAAVNKTTAENVFVFPNNKNIIMAAKQAAELSDRNIIVIETKTVPQGISALLGFDENAEPSDNAASMAEMAGNVRTAQVTYAARDSEFDGNTIKEGQLLGLIEGKVSFVEDTMEQIVDAMFTKILEDGGEFINIYYGDSVTEQDAQAICEKIQAMAPDAEIIVLPGGQPVYHYIFSVE